MEIFRKAQLFGEHTLLDRNLIIKAQQLFRGLKDYSLFINIFPSTLLEEDFIFWWDNHSEKLPNIVLELSESEPISDWQSVKFVLKQLRDRNIRIAIDDLGQGHSSLQHWIELEPEYVKIDRYYMMDIIRNERKQRIIEGLIKMLGDTTQLIFEGVEDIETLKTAKDLGVSCAQGYLLGMPSPVINIGPMVLL
jgi:EAL domain-containing protein (putative c-di-GMP-specific phosphodiesterase class I)